MNLDEMRLDSAIKQKKGLHFILASVFIWIAILLVQLTAFPVLAKNLFTFCAAAPLMPLAFMISKIIKADFSNKENPLNNLGILFALNQLLYLLIAMWIYSAVPEKMVMILAMIFGAHLLPFGWFYRSKSYTILSVVIPISALFIGINFPAYAVAEFMIVIEIIFSLLLYIEVRKLPDSSGALELNINNS